jgi:ABC-type antimicrobial peptide transport system permease subunit
MLLKNYLLVALRSTKKHKVFSLINVLGLALGLAVFILAALYMAHDAYFDTFHQKADRICLVVQCQSTSNKGMRNSAIIPAPFLPAMKNEFPEIEDSVRIYRIPRIFSRYEGKKFFENLILLVDPNFLTFFDFEMIKGDPQTALSQPNGVVLTEEVALRYFGEENPLGKTINFQDTIDVTVTGVVKKPPVDSSIRFEMLMNLEVARTLYDWMDNWQENTTGAFVLLPRGYDPSKLEAKLPGFLKKYVRDTPGAPERLFLLPLLSFHKQAFGLKLYSYLYWDMPYEVGYFFMLLAIAGLLVVCINFTNLSTAYHMTRVKEVGLRKVVGASRYELIKQFLGESIVTAFIALPLALISYRFIAPVFIAFFGMNMDLSLLKNPIVIPIILVVTVLVGILAGSYPAFYLSVFRPSHVLKGPIHAGKQKSLFRKILVVSQFVFAIILIVITLVTQNQLEYTHDMDPGYKRAGVLLISSSGIEEGKVQVFKERLKAHSEVVNVSSMNSLPVYDGGGKYSKLPVIPEGFTEETKWTMRGYVVDNDAIETLDIKIIKGRSFSEQYNDIDNVIINETAARQLKWENPVGKRLTFLGKRRTIIGVAKNFVFCPVYLRMGPTVLFMGPERFGNILIRISSNSSLSAVRPFLENQWRDVVPDMPFQLHTIEALFYRFYRYITELRTIFQFIGLWAIFISGVGLLGLTSYAVSRRTKEIGVRKVFGATMHTIFKMLFSEFMMLIVIANIIAWPLAYFLTDGYLKYAWSYRSDMGIGVFVLATVIIVGCAIVSIIYHTLKASRTPPVEALRYE